MSDICGRTEENYHFTKGHIKMIAVPMINSPKVNRRHNDYTVLGLVPHRGALASVRAAQLYTDSHIVTYSVTYLPPLS